MARFWGGVPRLLRVGLIAGLVTAILTVPMAMAMGRTVKAGSDSFLELPSELTEPDNGQTSYVYAADGTTLLTMFYEEYRHYIPLSQMSPNLFNAIVAAEDSRFYAHNGVDVKGIARAFVANQQAGSVSQGGSTLTMQYVRMALRDSAPTPEEVLDATEQTNVRKLREVRLATALEQRLSKPEILERYLNLAYFGHRAYGAYSAAQIYFSKTPAELSLAEAALLAGLVKAPTDFDPASQDPTLALDRRNYVLTQMAEQGYATAEQARAAMAQPLALTVYQPPNDCISVPVANNDWGYFCDFFKNWWMRQPEFGAGPQERLAELRRGGYQIVTSIDPAIQRDSTARVMEKEPASSALAHGLVVIEPGTGQVKAMAVNRVYSIDQSANGPSTDPTKAALGLPGNYPNTVNALLGGGDLPGYQAGSTFKMFTMLAALEGGLPLTTAYNSPRRIASIFPGDPGAPSTCGDRWCPGNASDAMTGVQNMWSGFGKSVNTYFVQLEQTIGVPAAVRMAERLGLRWRSSVDAELASTPGRTELWGAFTLGVADTTPLEMANAYATVAADGVYCEPVPVKVVKRPNGSEVADFRKCNQAVPVAAARAATDAARCVTGFGAAGGSCGDWSTAGGVYAAVGRPVAGKTGTTDDTRAAWFVGFTPQLAAASFIADPDNPFNLAGDGNSQKPVNSVSEVLRSASESLPTASFTYP
jgi:membrane peptidoglycan carboxypeptidase